MSQQNGKREFVFPSDINLNVLFQLLKHREVNYAVFAVSRITSIAKIIGLIFSYQEAQEVKNKLIPELLKYQSQCHDPQVLFLLQKAIRQISQKNQQ